MELSIWFLLVGSSNGSSEAQAAAQDVCFGSACVQNVGRATKPGLSIVLAAAHSLTLGGWQRHYAFDLWFSRA